MDYIFIALRAIQQIIPQTETVLLYDLLMTVVTGMSEYQYYEFLAIDRPLTVDEVAALRALSTRATITPVSFTNEYNWGDFKGNPDKLMQRYFDAHVYVANWMTAIFKVRLPMEALTRRDR